MRLSGYAELAARDTNASKRKHSFGGEWSLPSPPPSTVESRHDHPHAKYIALDQVPGCGIRLRFLRG